MDTIAGAIQGGTMKIIIFIIIACTLFVAWSLCIVGASADEQLEMIYAKDLERKEQREKLSRVIQLSLIHI